MLQRIVHVPYGFYPDPVGGTEIYVAALARELSRLGVDSLVAAPAAQSASYRVDGIPVQRFHTGKSITLHDLHGQGDEVAANSFGDMIDDERPSLVHLHAFTSAVSVRLIREVKKRQIPIVFTYHTPTVTCRRGTLLLFGSEQCDGKLNRRRCSACAVHGNGVPETISRIIGSLPVQTGKLVRNARLTGTAWTALRTTELQELRTEAFHCLVNEVDHIVAPAQWAKDVLERNGVPKAKLSLCRQGLPQEPQRPAHAETGENPVPDRPFRLAFVGRLVPVKGIHVLIRALQAKPEANVSLDIYGIEDPSSADYLNRLRGMIKRDPRIQLKSAIPAASVPTVLRRYHLLAVPSQWMETGPLVVLEAFAAATPIIGSNLGGIAELVSDGVNGLLVKPDSVEMWAQMIEQISENDGLYRSLKSAVSKPRLMSDVANEMQGLYSGLLSGKTTATAAN